MITAALEHRKSEPKGKYFLPSNFINFRPDDGMARNCGVPRARRHLRCMAIANFSSDVYQRKKLDGGKKDHYLRIFHHTHVIIFP